MYTSSGMRPSIFRQKSRVAPDEERSLREGMSLLVKIIFLVQLLLPDRTEKPVLRISLHS